MKRVKWTEEVGQDELKPGSEVGGGARGGTKCTWMSWRFEG